MLPELAISSFIWVNGMLNGLSIGIVNYAWKLYRGAQIGLIKIVRDNMKSLMVLSIFKADFDCKNKNVHLCVEKRKSGKIRNSMAFDGL
jgi:hypothetical protein